MTETSKPIFEETQRVGCAYKTSAAPETAVTAMFSRHHGDHPI
jgi:hypothetical protein